MSRSPSPAQLAAACASFEAHEAVGGRLLQWCDGRRPRDLFARFATTFERLGTLSGQRGLDIGCGSGHYLAAALDRGAAQVVGIDPAPGMLELARRRLAERGLAERATLVEGYFPQVELAGAFDFALAVGVFDYVAAPLEFLAALRPLVGRLAIVTFPRRHWLRSPLRRLRHRRQNCPVFFYREHQIHVLARDAGFASAGVIELDGPAADYHALLIP